MAHAAAEITWLISLLSELGVTNLKPVVLHCDNQSALHIARNPVFHERQSISTLIVILQEKKSWKASFNSLIYPLILS